MPAVAMSKTRGATVVEFVIVIPTLLMMIMAMLQAAFAFHTESRLASLQRHTEDIGS